MNLKFFNISSSLFILLLLTFLSLSNPATASAATPVNVMITNGGLPFSGVIPDGVTKYNITMSSTDQDGSNHISEQLITINHQGPNAGMKRGYFGWSNQNFKHFAAGDTVQIKNCTGTGGSGAYGQAALNNKVGWNSSTYMTLHSCTSQAGNFNRTTTFVVSFKPVFKTPDTNYFSMYTEDDTAAVDTWQLSGAVYLDLPPVHGMTVPSQNAVQGQASNLEKFAQSYPNFAYYSDWTGGTDAAGIISNKCANPKFIPMVYNYNNARPPEACDDGRMIILGNECGPNTGQCNATEDQEYAMWQAYRDWEGPIVICNQTHWTSIDRCERLIERYEAQYGPFPVNTYLGLHTYVTYDETSPGVFQRDMWTSNLDEWHSLSSRHNLRRFVGEWGAYTYDGNTTAAQNKWAQDMQTTLNEINSHYNPDIMTYFTTRTTISVGFEVNNLLKSNGTLTTVGTKYFDLFYD